MIAPTANAPTAPPTATLPAAELVLDVVRQDGGEHRERDEVEEPARDDEDEARGQESRGSGLTHEGYWFANASASVPRAPIRDHAAVLHHLTGTIDAERAENATAAAEQRDELALRERAVRDLHVGVGGDDADALDLAVVLIGPDERHRREGHGATGIAREQALRDVHALFRRVRPVLEPHRRAVEQWIRPARDVARDDHAGRGEAGLVTHHSVVERQPGPFEPGRLGHHPHPDDDHVGVDRVPVSEPHTFDATGAFDRVDLYAGAQIDAVVAVKLGDDAPHFRAEAAHHRLWQGLEHRDVEPAQPTRRGDLGADEARADHHDAWSGLQIARVSRRASSSVRNVNSPSNGA